MNAVLAAAGHRLPPSAPPTPPACPTARSRSCACSPAAAPTRRSPSQLEISVKTAGNHVQHIFEKIGVTTRAAATLFAMQNDLLSDPTPMP